MLPPRIPTPSTHVKGGGERNASQSLMASTPSVGIALAPPLEPEVEPIEAQSGIPELLGHPVGQPDQCGGAAALSDDLAKKDLGGPSSPRVPKALRRGSSCAAHVQVSFADALQEKSREVTEADRHRAATTIQRLARGFFVRLRTKQHRAAVVIQRHVKGILVRRKFKEQKDVIAETAKESVEYQGNVAGFYSLSGISVQPG